MRLSQAMQEELAGLPKGSIRERKINNRSYYYLNYRDGNKIKSDYVAAADLEHLQAQLARRNELKAALKEQAQSQKQIIRALGRKPDAN